MASQTPVLPPKRITLAEQLATLRSAPEDEQLRVIQKVANDSTQYRGFRHHAPSTQKRQDHHLAMFRDWMFFKHKRSLDDFASENEVLGWLFPSDPDQHSNMCEELRQFLIYVYQQTLPRSAVTGTQITYRSLSHYRDSLLFWVRRTFRLRGQLQPANSTLHSWMTDAMRAVVAAYPNTGPKAHEKSHIGLAELRELFDAELMNNTSVEYSEQHWAAWTIGRATACRAGSICISRRDARNKALTWDDLEFSVGTEPGQFNLLIKFGNIRIKRPEDPEARNRKPGDDSLHITLQSPSASNLIFSAAHRLLVIALRRGILEGIDSLNELLASGRKKISIKEEHRHEALFFAGKIKGDGIDRTRQLTAGALQDYLRTRAQRMGWRFTVIGFTSIRRRALTDVAARVGVEAARRIAGHAPDSFTLEQYYLNIGPTFQQTAVMLDEDISPGGFSDQLRKTWAPLAMGKIDDPRIRRTRGVALRAMTDRLALSDENPPAEILHDPAKRQLYRRRLRRIAQAALREREHEESEREMTVEEYEKRQRLLQASKFAEKVLKRALASQRERAATAMIGEDADEGQEEIADPEDDLDDAQQEAEEDLEDMVSAGDLENNELFLSAETEMDEESAANLEVQDVPYVEMASAFMGILLENSLNQRVKWADRDQTCPECAVDETVPLERKPFKYNNEKQLEQHLSSNYHTGFAKFRRGAEIRREAQPDDLYICTYCEQTADDQAMQDDGDAGQPTYSTFASLEEHLKTSSEAVHGKRHEELKEIDGWYETEFYKQPLEDTARKARQMAHKNLRAMGVELIHQSAIGPPGREYPDFPGVVRGAGASTTPERFAHSVQSGLPQSDHIPLKYAGNVAKGIAPTSAVPPAFSDVVVHGQGGTQLTGRSYAVTQASSSLPRVEQSSADRSIDISSDDEVTDNGGDDDESDDGDGDRMELD